MSDTPPRNPDYVMVFPLYFAGSNVQCQLSLPQLQSKEDFVLLKRQLDSALATLAATTRYLSVEYDAGTSRFRFFDDDGEESNA